MHNFSGGGTGGGREGTLQDLTSAQPAVVLRFSLRSLSAPLWLRRTLDLACGSGEMTLLLRELCPELGVPLGRMRACDPFTYAAYEERLGECGE